MVHRHAVLLASISTICWSSVTAAAADLPSQSLEHRVKAGFLYNFVRYVEWPKGTFGSSTNALVIGVLGEDPFGGMLDAAVAGKTVDNHPIRVERIQRVAQAGTCQYLFVSDSEKERLADILARLRDRSILTVSDVDGFLARGGQIQFVIDQNRVMFDVNLEAVRRAGLTVDANLLRVAL